jgi:hypothetical protein
VILVLLVRMVGKEIEVFLDLREFPAFLAIQGHLATFPM